MKTFVGAVKFFRKFRHPEIVLRQVQMRSERRKHLHHCRELRTAHTLWCLLRLHGKHCTPERVNELDRVVPLHMHFILRLIRRSTPRRLSKREELIVANLKIKPSGLLQLCSLRAFEHIHTVVAILNLQTDAKLRIAANLIVYHTGRFLRCEDQVHAQTSTDTRNADQLVHKLRLLLFQLSKLIRNEEQMRQRLIYTAIMVQPLIEADIHCPLV